MNEDQSDENMELKLTKMEVTANKKPKEKWIFETWPVQHFMDLPENNTN